MNANDMIEYLKEQGVKFVLLDEGRTIRSLDNGLCPICEACYRKYGERYPNCLFEGAANMLGLDDIDRQAVLCAADNFYITAKTKQLRKHMLDVLCGCSEKEEEQKEVWPC